MDNLIQSVDPKILKGVGAQIVIWTFYDQVVKVGKGWVEQDFALFNNCSIAKWSRVAKWVNILQDSIFVETYLANKRGENTLAYLETFFFV